MRNRRLRVRRCSRDATRGSWARRVITSVIFPEDAGVFTEALEEAGYDVAFTGKGWAPGNPGMKNGRRRQLTGEAWQNRKLTPPTSEMLATDYAANFSDFLSSREDASRPWFFWFGCREPHRRYEYGSGSAKGM